MTMHEIREDVKFDFKELDKKKKKKIEEKVDAEKKDDKDEENLSD